MTDKTKQSLRLKRALKLTLAGMWWEALVRTFWPLATLICVVFAGLGFGVTEMLPAHTRPYIGAVVGLALLAVLIHRGKSFRRPDVDAARRRVDAALPDRPLSALEDEPALGGVSTLWQAHLVQMTERAADARIIWPDAGLSRRDPYGLRLAGLTALVMTILFGSIGQTGRSLAGLAPKYTSDLSGITTGGLGWEGWAEPPLYTRKPTIYLNNLSEDEELNVPEGSIISLRLYSEDRGIEQTIGTVVQDDDLKAVQIRVEHNGMLTVGDRKITVNVRPDDPPYIAVDTIAERRIDGRLIQPFSAGDDYGVTAGKAVVTLDLDKVRRTYGLALDPEPRDPIRIRLPLRNGQPEIKAQFTADLKKHAWANLPVEILLSAQDGIGQTAQSDPLRIDLPGRRFFDPLAAALIELRRDILWNRKNAAYAARLLRAIIWKPEGVIDDQILPDLQVIITGLENNTLTGVQRDSLAEALWRIAVKSEDGGLSDALERMQRAQEKLSSAMRRGASPDEIQSLMDELRQATDDYIKRSAEQDEDSASKFDRRPRETLDGDQIQKMMDQIQRLMNEGRMAEARALLEQFNRMMENLQVQQGEGEGRGESGSDSSDRATETLREQQDLADRVFRELQNEWLGQDTPTGESEGETSQNLADQQSQLRDDLDAQRTLLPERGSSRGQAATEAMDKASRAMEDAEQALREGDTSKALDRQAEAIDALRNGIRALDQREDDDEGDRQAVGQTTQDGASEGQEQSGTPDAGRTQRSLAGPSHDPLGRELRGNGGNITTDSPFISGDDSAGHARDLQEEIRRRLGERNRPQAERDYLDRLIDHF